MSNPQLFFGDSSSDNDDIFDPASDASLPFPKPLDPSSFLTPTFSAADFLSSLTTRFQTLEDLQSELQHLLDSLNKDLVDLVNDNYTSFLNLGQKLSGGEERIEQVRVGLLGFHRDVTGLRHLVNQRSSHVRTLLDQKRDLRKQLQLGRALLEIDERITDLEEKLNLASGNTTSHAVRPTNDEEEDDHAIGHFQDWSEDWSYAKDLSASAGDDDPESDIPPTLRNNVQDFLVIQRISETCGKQHPFLLAQTDRMHSVGTVLRRDLEAAVRAQSDVRTKQRIIQLKARLEEHD